MSKNSDLERRLFEHLKRECQETQNGEIITKVEELRQALEVPVEMVYPAVVALRARGLLTTQKKGRHGMAVRVLREEETPGELMVKFCPNCGRRIPTPGSRFCYNCGEPLAKIK